MKKLLLVPLLLFAFLLNAQVYTAESDVPFEYQVSLGLVDGWSTVSKFGENLNITTASDPEDIWDFGGLYVWSDTSNISKLASSNAGDNQMLIVYGLDSLWRDTFQYVTLNGQTPVKLGFRLWRAYRMINIGTTDLAGTVSLITSAGTFAAGVPVDDNTIRAQIVNGNNQTLMTPFTIPVNTTGLFTGAIISMTGSGVSSQYVKLELLVRPYGSVFQVKQTVQLVTDGTSTTQFLVFNPLNIPARSDVVIRAKEVSATMGVSAAYGITLVED